MAAQSCCWCVIGSFGFVSRSVTPAGARTVEGPGPPHGPLRPNPDLALPVSIDHLLPPSNSPDSHAGVAMTKECNYMGP